jgi:short-subunit dehydrogenase
VNNAALSYESPQEFLNLPEDRMEDIINLNVLALTKMTRIVLPKMTAQYAVSEQSEYSQRFSFFQ